VVRNLQKPPDPEGVPVACSAHRICPGAEILQRKLLVPFQNLFFRRSRGIIWGKKISFRIFDRVFGKGFARHLKLPGIW
jgi:hypothetical protein